MSEVEGLSLGGEGGVLRRVDKGERIHRAVTFGGREAGEGHGLGGEETVAFELGSHGVAEPLALV